MTAHRKPAILIILLLAAMLLTACGKSSDDSKKAPTATATPEIVTPTFTPTPTEAPKTAEQMDQAAIINIMDAAKKTVTDSGYTLEEGARFNLKFDDGKIALELETSNGYQRRVWQEWIRYTSFAQKEYSLQSETYRKSCRYATINGVLENGGTIRWTADNIDDTLFDFLSGHGIQWDPTYLQRAELFEEIQGYWYGEAQMSISSLVDAFVDKNDTESITFYKNLVSLLKKYGFSGNIPVGINCSMLSVKELHFALTIDWSGFQQAIDKATSTKDSMTKFLCVCTGASESTLKAALKQRGLDVMTFGQTVIAMINSMCDEYHGEQATCTYTLSGNELQFKGSGYSDKMTYDKEKGTLVYLYRDMGIECVLRKQN